MLLPFPQLLLDILRQLCLPLLPPLPPVNTECSLVVFTPPSKMVASTASMPLLPTLQSPPPPVITESMDEDVDIGDLGTHRIMDEAYEVENPDSPTHNCSQLNPTPQPSL